MQNREFEKKVQEQMEQLKFTPADAVWDKVEAGLPEEKKRRRWIVFILVFGLLTAGSLLLWKNLATNNIAVSNNNKYSANHTATTKETDSQPVRNKNKENDTNVSDSNTVATKSTKPGKTGNDNAVTGTANKKISATSFSKIKIKKAKVSADIILEDDIVAANKLSLKTKAAAKVKTKAPQPVADNEEVVTAADEKAIITIADTGIVKTKKFNADSLSAANKKHITDMLAVEKKDTAVTVKKESTKKSRTKWQYGIDVAAGSSAVKNNLFSNTLAYSNAYSSSVSSSPGSGISTEPNKPSKGLALSAGFYAARVMAGRWQFKTGLSYSYQSNIMKVGSKVDSAATFNFDINKSIAAGSYFRPGNSVSYRNNFHLLEIPLLFQYRLSKKSPLNLEIGPAINYLISSNALVYSNSSGAYFTGKDIFNKLLLSFTAGAGITFAQDSKYPVTIGYRFKYGGSSVIKNSLSKQHFVNSMLYLKIPFKK
ncbi:porin family protein [Ferruginibacter profundus]